MSGRVTTHVLDLSRGVPAVGMVIQLWKLGKDRTGELVREAIANSDGRLDAPLLAGEEVTPGSYELLFMVGDYFRAAYAAAAGTEGLAAGGGGMFLEAIPIRFNVNDPAEHYHVPLLVAPGGYSTYRGS